MTAQQRQFFTRQLRRHAILLQLEAASPASLPAETLLQGLRLAGHPLSANELLKETAYLEEKQLLSTYQPDLDHAVRRFRLSATGRDYLENHGLA